MVEHRLPKPVVAGSIPVSRSTISRMFSLHRSFAVHTCPSPCGKIGKKGEAPKLEVKILEGDPKFSV
jgi:hypothetical protein